ELRLRLDGVLHGVEEDVAVERRAGGNGVGDADGELPLRAGRAGEPVEVELRRRIVVAADADRGRVERAGDAEGGDLRGEVDGEVDRPVHARGGDGGGDRHGVVPAGERIRRQPVDRVTAGERGDVEAVRVANGQLAGDAVVARADVRNDLGDRRRGVRPVRRLIGGDGERQRRVAGDRRDVEVLRDRGVVVGILVGDRLRAGGRTRFSRCQPVQADVERDVFAGFGDVGEVPRQLFAAGGESDRRRRRTR